MNNTVYYIKPTNNDIPEVIKDGLIKALSLVSIKGYSNIKFVVTGLGLLDPPNYISEAFNKLFPEKGVKLTTQLKKNRGFPIRDFPSAGQTTGINLLLSNSNPTFTNENTVVLLWSDFDSFMKIQSTLFWTQIDLVAIVFNETQKLNELLSASKAINISKTSDPKVIPYINTFAPNINDILDRLVGINITDVASHTPTRERMNSVITELTKKHFNIPYLDFLGFLVNEVNFKLEESVELLNWKHTYFGR